MSETKYVKCPCQKCGGSIEFPASGVGIAVNCPHCSQRTTLFAPPVVESRPPLPRPEPAPTTPSPDSTPPPTFSKAAGGPVEIREAQEGSGRRRWIWALLIVLVLAAPAILYLLRETWVKKSDHAALLPTTTNQTSLVESKGAEPGLPLAKGPKSTGDLKVGAITLEKAKGSSLVYAVGTLRNNSDHQRFGVNLEVELADARGNKAGIAKDYRPVIEPRQEWRFRALVLDPKAASARLSAIREED